MPRIDGHQVGCDKCAGLAARVDNGSITTEQARWLHETCGDCQGTGYKMEACGSRQSWSGVVISCDPKVSGLKVGQIRSHYGDGNEENKAYPHQFVFTPGAAFGIPDDSMVCVGARGGRGRIAPIQDYDALAFMHHSEVVGLPHEDDALADDWAPTISPGQYDPGIHAPQRDTAIIDVPGGDDRQESRTGSLITSGSGIHLWDRRFVRVHSSAIPGLNAGDMVLVMRWRHREFWWNGKAYGVIRWNDILAKGEVA